MRTESFKTLSRHAVVALLVAEGMLTFLQENRPCFPGQGKYLWKGTPIFQSDWAEDTFGWLPEGRNLAEAYKTDFTGMLKLIAENGESIPKYFFKNGKCRIAELRILVGRIADRRTRSLPLTGMWIDDVSINWGKMSAASKQILSVWFDTTTGEFKGEYENLNILGHGPLDVNPSYYRRVSDLIANGTYVKLSDPIVTTIKYKGIDFPLTQKEKDRFDALWTKCSSCGAWEKTENTVFSLCTQCTGDFPKTLRGYGDRATSTFGFISKSKVYSGRYLGVELEYERKGDFLLSENLYLLHRNLKGHAIFKRDGSLSQGIEICTRPASADIHIEEFKKMFEDSQCMSALEVKTSCGMHVHIDRSKMSALSLGKMLKFMQAKENKEFLELMAGRKDNSYCKLGTGELVSAHLRGLTSERYRGLNLTNTATAEIRIFRTPDTMDTFINNIEFVTALSDFVQPANSGVSDCNSGALTKFVLSNRRSYPSLHKSFKGVAQ